MIWITFFLIAMIVGVGLLADRLVIVFVAFASIVIIYASLIARGLL